MNNWRSLHFFLLFYSSLFCNSACSLFSSPNKNCVTLLIGELNCTYREYCQLRMKAFLWLLGIFQLLGRIKMLLGRLPSHKVTAGALRFSNPYIIVILCFVEWYVFFKMNLYRFFHFIFYWFLWQFVYLEFRTCDSAGNY